MAAAAITGRGGRSPQKLSKQINREEEGTMVTINCDMGEAFSIYKLGDDERLMPLIDVANVACGFHGSDFNHMRRTVRLAKQHGVKVGAHPSLPDLQGFGRREMKMGREEMANCILYQIGALKAFLDAEGVPLNHIKPHGSLYGMASRMEEIAEAVADAADVYKVPLFGMKGTLHESIYPRRGHTFVAEYYADLDYNPDGSLIVTRRQGRCRGGVALFARHHRWYDPDGRRHRRRRRLRLHLRAFRHAECRRDHAGRAQGGSFLSAGALTRPPDHHSRGPHGHPADLLAAARHLLSQTRP